MNSMHAMVVVAPNTLNMLLILSATTVKRRLLYQMKHTPFISFSKFRRFNNDMITSLSGLGLKHSRFILLVQPKKEVYMSNSSCASR